MEYYGFHNIIMVSGMELEWEVRIYLRVEIELDFHSDLADFFGFDICLHFSFAERNLRIILLKTVNF